MEPERMVVRTEDVVGGNLWQCFPVINIDKIKDIPADYPGAMGVPITIFDKFDRRQFEILDMVRPAINGKTKYRRIVIRNLHPDLPEYIDLAAWFGRMGVPLDVQFIGVDVGSDVAEQITDRMKPGA